VLTARLLLVAAWLLVAWGALAFGAVYPWAWMPLVTGCTLVGLMALGVSRGRPHDAGDRGLLAALAFVIAGALLQMTPLPSALMDALSPSAARVLADQNLAFATAESRGPHALSLDPVATARGVILLTGFTVWVAGLTRLLHVTGARAFSTSLVVFGVVLAVIGMVQKAMLGDHAYAGMKIYGFWSPSNPLTTPFGPFVNRNHFAGWMLMGLPLALGIGLGWAERAGRHVTSWRDLIARVSSPEAGRAQLMAAAVLVMGSSIFMTRSRSGVAGMVLAMGLAAVVAGRRSSSARTRLATAAAIVAVISGLVLWGGRDVVDRVRAGGAELRPQIWRDSVAVIRDFPLTGTGLNTFGTAMLSYQSAMRGVHFREAHNDYLQVLVEGGLLLGVPAALALAALARGVRRRFRDGRDDAMTHWIRVGATTGLVAIALQSLVEFSLQMPGNAAFAALLMAVALHAPPPRRRH
jgi:O-antigen ligase